MIGAIAGFELKRRFTRPSTYIYFALFCALAFFIVIAAGGAFNNVSVGFGAGSKVLVNSPYTLSQLIALTSYFGLLVTAAMTGQAVFQDFQTNSYPFFFTAPISKTQYLGGRFLGAAATVLFVFAGIGLGCFVGAKMPFVEKSLFGPNRLAAYVWPYLTIVIPNLIFTGALFFGLAALTRKIAPVYVTSVVLLIGYLIAQVLSAKVENKALAALIDPFGLHAAGRLTEYWTIAEKNTRLVPLSGIFLFNRLLWIGVGLAVLAFTWSRFRFAHRSEGGAGRSREPGAPATATVIVVPKPDPAAAPSALRQLVGLTLLGVSETVKNLYFFVIVLAGVLFMIVGASTMGSLFGTDTYPVTYEVLELVSGSFGLFMIILITLYAGELVWRERDARVDQLMDALPISNWLPYVSKLLALILVQALLLVVVMLTGIAIQTVKGYFHYELGLYLKELFGLQLLNYALLCVLAMLVQVLVNQKYMGHFVMVVYYLVTLFMDRFGLEHHLYKYGSAPNYTYSDMNGYGHFLRPVLYFNAYWAAFAVLLAIVSGLFWVRGLETRFRRRIELARARFSRPVQAVTLVAATAFLGLGGFIFYNTNVLNHYRTRSQRSELQADYEKKYKALEKEPQPRITDVDYAADIFPGEQRLRAHGRYQLVNRAGVPISNVYVNVDPEVTVHKLALGALAHASTVDDQLGLQTFHLPQPLKPGETTTLDFDLDFFTRGFKNDDPQTTIVENGTFFSSGELPHLGYQQDAELGDDDARRKHGLKPKERMADVNDAEARKNTYIANDADWINLTTTVSTSADQLGLAPGALEKEWQEGNRRYFTYRSERVLSLFAVLSARYQVKRDKWKDVDIEIDYHPGHEYNVETMIKAIQKSLDYYTQSFGPYQHKLVRIVEFPRYQSFAQSLPNIIPYSESIGFIARVNPFDPEDVNYPFYVTAHEVAHQWWAHQVIGGNVQGSTMLSETMAQYSALMVMKHELGAAQMRRFLKYELDRYLIGRSVERKKELPLDRVENQPYIHYQKGSLVMYALQDYLGEDVVNKVLASYLKRVAGQMPPYTNSLELLADLKQATPPELAYIIDDWFDSITLYDNRALEAHARKVGDQYEVKLVVTTKKLRANELGVENERPVDDLFVIGVYGDDGKQLYWQKQRLKGERNELTLKVAELPVKAGIDPLNELIDRRSDDNVVNVKVD